MFDIFIAIAIAGSAIAGIWDLLTTEVPDEIPALMITLGLFFQLINSGITGDFYPLTLSLAVGTALLIIGLLMYKKGQWGGADAWILAAIGYLIPLYNGDIFIVGYLFNFLIVSAAYMIVYAIIIGIKDPSVFQHFSSELRARWKVVAGIPLAYAVFAVAAFYTAGYAYSSVIPLLYTLVLIAFLAVFWVYGRVIEKYAFRKRIPSGKLKPGDVLDNMLWRGITADEIKAVRKKKRYVIIKEGVRFVPVFPITLIVTLLFGNILFMLIF